MVPRLVHMAFPRRLASLALIPLIALVGCAGDSDGGDPNDAPTSQPATPTSQPAATPTPPEETAAEASPGETATEAAAEPADADPDLQEGVRTNDFQRMPKELGELGQVSSRTDPQTHVALMEYMAADESAKIQLRAYLAESDDGTVHGVTSTSDEAYIVGYRSAKEAFEGPGNTVHEFTSSSGSHEWECVESPGSQGNIDHTLCQTLAHGRIVEVQYLAVAESDDQVRSDRVDAVLQDVADALTALA